MRTIVGLLVAALAGGPATAQEAAWNDPTGRLSFDLAGTGWEMTPRSGSASRVILNLGPKGTATASAADITKICMLDHLRQPTEAPRTQADADVALTKGWAEDEKARLTNLGQPYTEQIVIYEGVSMHETTGVQSSPATGKPLQTIRRNFILSTPGAYHFMGLMCVVDESAEPNGRAELRSIMDRMRIAAGAGG